jgi:hypothetical protein
MVRRFHPTRTKEGIMITKPQTAAIGLFDDPKDARQAVRALRAAGFSDEEIGVLAPHSGEIGENSGTHAGEGAAVGIAAGAGTGALWALGISAGLLPGIGPVIAGGLLASVLSSAAGTAAVGGIIGALVGLGIPEEEADYYESELKAGRTLVSVQSTGRAAEAWTILERYAAHGKRTASAAR